ncbi:MAG: hypothetical protein JXR78_15710 [Victivallales bacterium]|nr:hypothetical protein [Victivallales bacterium]
MKKSDVEKLVKEYLENAASESFQVADKENNPETIYLYAFEHLQSKIKFFIEEFEKLK